MAVTTVEERLSRLEGVYDHLASKADVARVETQIARVETQVADLRTELKGEIGALRGEMLRLNAGLIKWGVGLMAGFLVIGLGAVTAIFRLLG